jgi:hypothetical protein
MRWNLSLVMYDADTGTLWSHILGEAMQGALKGTKLEILPSELVTWSAWLKEHPDTTVLNMSRTNIGDRGRDFTSEWYTNPASPSTFVYGWSIGLQRYHVPLEVLIKEPVLNLSQGKTALLLTLDPASTDMNLFVRTLADRELSFAAAHPGRIRDEQTGSVWDLRTGVATEGPLKGQRLPRYFGMLSYREAWLTFYPRSRSVP